MNPLAWLNPGRWLLYASLLASICLGAWRLWENEKKSLEAVGYDRAKAECKIAGDAQASRNAELARKAELTYTVATKTQTRYITQTVKEITHETQNLAACMLSPDAVRLLNAAADCADSDSAAACQSTSELPKP